ncbi:MAG: cytochrome b/b6 domain-containing protein [Hyphomicrobiaceae bacterium]
MPKSTAEVWDPFLRVFHWGLVVSFAVTYFTGDEAREAHVVTGWAVLVLILFRVFWGFVGPTHARFAVFVKPPAATYAYLRQVARGAEPRHLGHNPAGGAMVVILLLITAGTGVVGVLLTTDAYWGSEAVDTLHSLFAHVTAACVAIHIAGVLFTSVRTRENLVWSMVTAVSGQRGKMMFREPRAIFSFLRRP